MKKILVTGFDPFGGETTNPALHAVMALPDVVDGIQIIREALPTVYGKSFDVLQPILVQARPHAAILVGQAGGRSHIAIERVAINIDDAKMADNEGVIHTDQPIAPDGPAAYFATLPVKAIVDDLHQAAIPGAISNTAGTFVCNHVMYKTLHYAATNQTGMKAGFIHVPYLPTQTLTKPTAPSMSLDYIVAGLKIIIQTVGRDGW